MNQQNPDAEIPNEAPPELTQHPEFPTAGSDEIDTRLQELRRLESDLKTREAVLAQRESELTVGMDASGIPEPVKTEKQVRTLTVAALQPPLPPEETTPGVFKYAFEYVTRDGKVRTVACTREVYRQMDAAKSHRNKRDDFKLTIVDGVVVGYTPIAKPDTEKSPFQTESDSDNSPFFKVALYPDKSIQEKHRPTSVSGTIADEIITAVANADSQIVPNTRVGRFVVTEVIMKTGMTEIVVDPMPR